MKSFFTFLLIISSISPLFAQRFYPYGIQSRDRISIGTGATKYYGDVQEDGLIDKTFNLTISYEYQLNRRWAFRTEGAVYQIKASDANSSAPGRQARNLSFHATNLELSGMLLLYLFKNLPAAYQERPLLNVYGLIGAGVSYYNPKTVYEGEIYQLRDYQTEGVAYSRFTPVFPLGVGIQSKLSKRFDIAFETSYRFSLTDYLDDVSTVYLAPNEYQSEIAASLADRRLYDNGTPEGTIRGNPGSNDGYAFYSLRITYYLISPYYRGNDRRKKLIR